MEWKEFWSALTIALVPVLIGFILALVKLGMNYLTALAEQKLSETNAIKAAEYRKMIDETLTSLITSAGETVVRAMKQEKAWNAEAAAMIKNEVLRQASAAFTGFKEDMQSKLVADLPTYMDARLEYILASLRAQGTIRPVTPGGDTPPAPQK